MELKTIKEVSTFHGFCKDHDSNLFKSIENFNGLPDEKSINLEQVVLMGLRAVARREYDNSFCIKMLEQHEKNPARKYEKYIKATNFYLDTYLKALSDPSIIDYTVIDFPQELFGNFLCAAYDDGVCVVTLPLQNQKLRAYISTTKASNKISLYKDNPKSVLLKALNNNMCFSPSWWSSISQDLKKKLLPNILAGKMCETVDYKGNVRKLQL